MIFKLLEIQKWGFAKYGAKRYKPLSKAAEDALKKKNCAFFRRFDAKHPELTKKRQGMVSIDRALNCSQEMARNHIDK